jgi:hypothetical protein
MNAKLKEEPLRLIKDHAHYRHEGRHHRGSDFLLASLPLLGLAAIAMIKNERKRDQNSDRAQPHSVTGPIWESHTSDPEIWNDATAAAMMTDVAGSRLDDPRASALAQAERHRDAPVRDATAQKETSGETNVTGYDGSASSVTRSEVMDNRPLVADEAVTPMADFKTILDLEIEDSEGMDLGKVDAIYYHEANQQPEWVAITVGLVNPQRRLAPLEAAHIDDGHVRLAYPHALIERSPSDIDGEVLSPAGEAALYDFYHVRRMLAPNHADMAPSDEVLRRWTEPPSRI